MCDHDPIMWCNSKSYAGQSKQGIVIGWNCLSVKHTNLNLGNYQVYYY